MSRAEFWSLTPARHSAMLRAWKRKMKREGFTFKPPPGSREEREQQAADQQALAAALSASIGALKAN